MLVFLVLSVVAPLCTRVAGSNPWPEGFQEPALDAARRPPERSSPCSAPSRGEAIIRAEYRDAVVGDARERRPHESSQHHDDEERYLLYGSSDGLLRTAKCDGAIAEAKRVRRA
jgi:hypothetical protein